MKKTNTISTLAMSRLRFQRSRTLLTGIAIMLTTMLLMAIGTVGFASLDMDRQLAVAQSNYHATFSPCTTEQISVLSKHINVEAMTTLESFADIVNGKMNGVLYYQEAVKDERTSAEESIGVWTPEEGHAPEAADEICSSPAFFRRMGVEPVIGGTVPVSFRVSGKGEIVTRDFTICGLLPDVEIAEVIDDSRLRWAAVVSKALLTEYQEAGLYEPVYDANLRVYGEEELSYDEMKDTINAVAADIGLDEGDVILNKSYLYMMTDPNTDAIVIVAIICLLVILFSVLVIYSIFYVGVITDVQEIGKLKALGATKRQIAKLFYRQGLLISAVAIPPGLLIGYLLIKILFPIVVVRSYIGSTLNSTARDAALESLEGLRMFSFPYLCLVTVAVLITVYLSLLKPIRMAKKISPAEAIRYQESSGSAKIRKGHRQVKVSTLAFANLTRNKKRTIVTILTMGLSCVLFICVSAVLSSISAEDIARRSIPRGDFRIVLDYSLADREYPEKNLDSLVQQDYFNDAFLDELRAIDGVTAVAREYGKVVSSTDIESVMYDDYENALPLSYFTRDDIAELNDCLQGDIDYDRMTANKEMICADAYSFNAYDLSLGDTFPVTLHDGDREIPFTFTLTALSEPDSNFGFLIMTEDTWNELGLTYDPTTSIYLEAEKESYDSVKETLTEIVAENEYFRLYSMDVETAIGNSSVSLVRYPVYLLLSMIAIIGFINLINTMITSIVTRRKELAILQAVGLSDRQLVRMLSGEGLVFTTGTLFISLTFGNLAGYLLYLWAKDEHVMSISHYHYPVWESLGLVLVLLCGQLLITLFIHKKMAQESLIDRIRNDD